MFARGLAMTWCAAAFSMLFFAAPPAAADWRTGLDAFNAGDLDTAASAFSALCESQPDWYGGHLMLGQTLLRQKKASTALRPLERAHELHPHASTALPLAQAAAALGRWNLVKDVLHDVRVESLESARHLGFHRLRGRAALGLGDWANATVQLERAAVLDPENADLHLHLALAARRTDQLQKAESHYQTALRLAPSRTSTLRDLTAVRHARAMAAAGPDRAQICRQAAPESLALLRDLKTTLRTRLVVAQLQACAGDRDRAETILKATHSRDLSNWQPLYHLARLYADGHRWTEAEAALEKLTRYRLDDADARRAESLWGRVYEGQQRFDLAIERYAALGDEVKLERARRALDIQRRNQELEEIQRQIDETLAAQGELDLEEKKLAAGHGD
ncbi:MAG: tetratricopeptide repeat protein [Acidobacteriota bacterium]